MTAAEVLQALADAGCTVSLQADDRILVKGPLTDELRRGIRENKVALLALLMWAEPAAWPAECLEAEERFASRHARLFPLIGQEVNTVYGRGRLWQVFKEGAGVILGDEGWARVVFVDPQEVYPPTRTRHMLAG